MLVSVQHFEKQHQEKKSLRAFVDYLSFNNDFQIIDLYLVCCHHGKCNGKHHAKFHYWKQGSVSANIDLRKNGDIKFWYIFKNFDRLSI